VAGLRDLDLGQGRRVPARHLSVRFTRAGGPGGQNVNKVATRAEVRLDLAGAEHALGPVRCARIRRNLATRIDAEGRLRVASAVTRHQARNVEAALVRMEQLLGGALAVPRARRSTKPTRASRERRLSQKRARADTKARRRRPADD
jgi:ribosome-associated protein